MKKGATNKSWLFIETRFNKVLKGSTVGPVQCGWVTFRDEEQDSHGVKF